MNSINSLLAKIKAENPTALQIDELIEAVESKKDLAEFIRVLRGTHPETWQNSDLPAYLSAVPGVVLAAGSVPGLVDLAEFSGEFYNPSRFQYTSAEGDVYEIDEHEGLQRMTDRNGNTLLVTTNGITWTNASTGRSLAITFQRDALSRITNILDAAGNALT